MTEKLRNSVTPRPWCLRKRVLPQHTDHAGVVWHGTYINWLEESRVEALAAVGMTYAEMERHGIAMPVVSLRIDYRRSLRHGDVVQLESRCGSQRGVRWPWLTSLKRGQELMAEASIELVMLEGAGRVLRRPPSALASVMQRLQLGPGDKEINTLVQMY